MPFDMNAAPRIQFSFSYELDLKQERMLESFHLADKVGCNSSYIDGRSLAEQILKDIPRLRVQLDEAEERAQLMLKRNPLPAPYSDE